MSVLKDVWDMLLASREWKELQSLARRVPDLERRIAALESAAAAPVRHCDHCGSTRTQRVGARPDPTFRALGVKQAVYQCEDCGKQSHFSLDPQ